MTGDRSPHRPRDDDEAAAGVNQGWTAVSYLIGGILVWGFVGWVIDRWWWNTGGIATAIGAVLGAAGGVYLIMRRLGA
jgi:F0F1-type ATP synthase assembly protein I